MTSRKLISLHRAMRDDIQDLTTRRPVPGPGLPQVDPFLFSTITAHRLTRPAIAGCPSVRTRIAGSRR